MSVVKVGINGFGRIGRHVSEAIRDTYPNELEVVAFNDIVRPSRQWLICSNMIQPMARFNGTVEVGRWQHCWWMARSQGLQGNGPGAIPWKDLGVDIVIESTGLFTIKEDGVNKKGKTVKARQSTSRGGAKKVIISAPAKART